MKVLYKNAEVYTGKLPLKEAFAVENGKFIFAGSNSEGEQIEYDEIIDLNGKFVCAGFNDSHMHLLNYGLSLSMAPLHEHTGSLKEMIEEMHDFASSGNRRGGIWVCGRGWNQDYFADVKRMPNRYDLDRVSDEYPVMCIRCCGHCLVVNSAALKLCGITMETIPTEGGRIGIENGELDGRFYDSGMDLIYNKIPVPGKEEIKNMICLASKALNSYGVTSCQSDDYCVFRSVPWQTVNEAYAELEASGELSVRVYEQSNFTNLSSLKDFVEAGCVTGMGSNLFKFGPLKLLGDGSLGARTAYLSEPYNDDPLTCGIPIFTQEQMEELIGYANEHDMQVAVHAIGDKTLDFVLNAVEKALFEHPRDDPRHGVVHCQITRADQLERLIKMKMHIYAQSIFLDYDIHILEKLVGGSRASTSYSWKTLMKNGCVVSNGTDCPVEPPDAMAGIQCAVTRSTLRDCVGPYLSEEAFTIQEALDSYTYSGAIASFEENVKGLIAPGYIADFVVLGNNPFAVDPFVLKDITIESTYLNGRKVF